MFRAFVDRPRRSRSCVSAVHAFLGLMLWCIVAPSAWAQGAAVVQSFVSQLNALDARAALQQALGAAPTEVALVPVEINGQPWQRLVVYPRGGESGRDTVARVRRAGYPDAWFWANPASQIRSAPAVAASPTIAAPATTAPTTAATAAIAPPAAPPIEATSDLRRADSSAASPAVMGSATLVGTGPGTINLIDTLDGIPRHGFDIEYVSEADAGITLDGKIDEPLWQRLRFYDEFMIAVPAKGVPGDYPTRMRLFASERGLYVSAIMIQPVETLVQRLSSRDDFQDRDTFGFTLDSGGEGSLGYWFIIALGGSQQDGKLLPERNYQRDWDGPWIGKSARRDDGWSAEMFLPWSMVNMTAKTGKRTLGFAATRQVSHKGERYQWPGHPYSSPKFLSAFNEVQVAGVQPVKQLAVIPFAAATVDEANDDDDLRVGLDLIYKPSPALQVSATANPDFGAVEADDVVLNLTAFETFFPEKRLFFLEGNEIFDAMPRASTGNIFRITANDDFAATSRRVFLKDFIPTPISLINTRRIGGTARQVTVPTGVTPNRGQRDLPTDLLGAAKLTGQIGGLRYGVLGAFEDDVEWLGSDALGNPIDIEDVGRDFGVVRVLYEDSGATRRSVGYLGTLVSGSLYDAEVHSIDGHYTSAGGKVVADVQLITSDVDENQGYGGSFDLMYALNGQWLHKFEVNYFDDEVNINDLGFLRRNNYANAKYVLLYNKQNLTDAIKNYRTTLILEQQYNIDPGVVTDSGIYWRNSMELPGRNTLKASLGYLPERWEDIDSRGNGAYRVDDRGWIDFLIATNSQPVFSFSAGVGALQEHLGDWTYSGSLGMTIRPSDKIKFDLDINYKKREGWLVYQGGRNFGRYSATEWQPSLSLDWFLAYNHQIKLSVQWAGVRAREEGFFGIPLGDGDLVPTARTLADHDFTVSLLTAQLRYRWEIAPLTDLFVVYNRGNTLPNTIDSPFDDLFDDVLRDPIIDSLVVKVRWRFGN
ncbi:MAG: DUF5916 domain-containing protein [Pseudomonadota bacterium]